MKFFASSACAVALAFGLLVGATPASASPGNLGNVTCNGGTVAPGVYQSLTIASGAFCMTGDAENGVIEIHGLLTLKPGSFFDAGEPATAKLWVQNNVVVGAGAFINLGCGGHGGGNGGGATAATAVAASDCSADYLNGALLANQALSVIIHGIQVRGDVSIQGGGGGTSCENLEGLPFPAFVALEDANVNGAVNISNLSTCWMGFIRNQIRGNAVDQNNSFADDDANEAVTNVINGAMFCSGNSPVVHFGDSEGVANIVRGGGHGECVPPLSNK